MTRQQRVGRWGERLASERLKAEGYEILASNVHTPYGELDLVARKQGVIAFVEVKTRSSDAFGLPEEAITAQKRSHLIQSAQAYLQSHPELDEDWRVDVIAIRILPDEEQPQIVWYENAIY